MTDVQFNTHKDYANTQKVYAEPDAQTLKFMENLKNSKEYSTQITPDGLERASKAISESLKRKETGDLGRVHVKATENSEMDPSTRRAAARIIKGLDLTTSGSLVNRVKATN